MFSINYKINIFQCIFYQRIIPIFRFINFAFILLLTTIRLMTPGYSNIYVANFGKDQYRTTNKRADGAEEIMY